MIITVYADSTGLFTEEFCNRNNLINIEVSRQTVFEFYRHEYNPEAAPEYHFENWLDEYTADDTTELWDYATREGDSPKVSEILF